jgi:glycine betaine/proline transport system substrate-binding protein
MLALISGTFWQCKLVLMRSLRHAGRKGLVIYLMLFCCVYTPLIRAHSQTVNLILLDWTSQRVLTFVMGNTLKQKGLKVDYITVTADQLPGVLARGLGHIQVEHWSSDFRVELQGLMEDGLIVNRGTHPAEGREEWWYPLYTKESCPGLPDWQALKRCAGLFAESDSQGKGVFWTGNWDNNNAELIRALELGFMIKRVDSAKMLWQKLYEAAQQNKPIMVYNWQPNWTNSRLPGEFIKFPEYQPECEVDPSWGISPTIAHDCGNPLSTAIIKLAWSGLAQLSPCADKLLENMAFSHLMIADAAAFSDIDGLSEQQAALKWAQKYHGEMQQWLTASCP